MVILSPESRLIFILDPGDKKNLVGLVDSHMPLPGSGAGYRPSRFVMPLLLMLHGGGQSLENLRQDPGVATAR